MDQQKKPDYIHPGDLRRGESASIVGFSGEQQALEMRLIEMGLIEGERIKLLRVAPFGDPIELEIQGTRLILRKREAACLRLSPD